MKVYTLATLFGAGLMVLTTVAPLSATPERALPTEVDGITCATPETPAKPEKKEKKDKKKGCKKNKKQKKGDKKQCCKKENKEKQCCGNDGGCCKK